MPAFLTVDEAVEILRIGRTSAYGLTREWLRTRGKSGLPVVKVGHKLRVPRRHLEKLAGGDLTAAPTAFPDTEPGEPPTRIAERSARRPLLTGHVVEGVSEAPDLVGGGDLDPLIGVAHGHGRGRQVARMNATVAELAEAGDDLASVHRELAAAIETLEDA